MPVTFPPETVPNGELLAGLPLPDIRGTMGTFYYFATDLSRYEEGNTEFGGILRRLVFDGSVARAELVGPPNPIVRQQERRLRERGTPSDEDKAELADLDADADVRLPFTITWNRDARTANIDIQGQTIHLSERGNGAAGSTSSSASTCWSGCMAWRSSSWSRRAPSCSSTSRR